jgi:hypothetical protein
MKRKTGPDLGFEVVGNGPVPLFPELEVLGVIVVVISHLIKPMHLLLKFFGGGFPEKSVVLGIVFSQSQADYQQKNQDFHLMILYNKWKSIKNVLYFLCAVFEQK